MANLWCLDFFQLKKCRCGKILILSTLNELLFNDYLRWSMRLILYFTSTLTMSFFKIDQEQVQYSDINVFAILHFKFCFTFGSFRKSQSKCLRFQKTSNIKLIIC